MVYVIETKKPFDELMRNLPLSNLLEFQMNVNKIEQVNKETEERNNVSRV